MMRSIRIQSIPPGDAPRHIREAWVGLVLPLADIVSNQPAICTTRSVLVDRSGLWHRVRQLLKRELEEQPVPAYIINARKAVDVLQQNDPAAAQWWRENTPHLLHGDRFFSFPANCCSELPEEQT